MQLNVILAIVGALLAAESAPGEPLSHVAQRTVLCGLLVALVVLSARMVATATVIGLQSSLESDSAWRARYRRLRAVHGIAWIAAAAAIYLGLGWPQIVRVHWQLNRFLILDELIIVLPVLLSLALSWWALGNAEQALEDRHVAGQARPRRSVSGLSRMTSLVRHVMAPALAPLLLVLAAQDVFDWLTPQGAPAALISVLFAVAAVLGYPWLLRCLWQTEPLADGALRDQLRGVERRMNIHAGKILVWNTSGTICNAAVAGIWSRCRYVFISDVLLARLKPDEVAAIYAHELGHVRHRHLMLRLLAILLPVVAWQAVTATFPALGEIASAPLATYGLSLALQTGLVTILIAAIYAATLFSWYCRALEHEADLCGCQIPIQAERTSEVQTVDRTESFVEALASLSALTQSSRQASRSTWLHPATTCRIAFVRQMAAAPQQQREFEGRMRRGARLLVAMVAGLAVWPWLMALLVR